MKLNIIKSLIIVGALAVSLPAATINQRRANQQNRIAQGVQSGQLTARETSHLEGREAHLNREIHRDKALNGGHLTSAERVHIQHQQNRISRSIYRDKHNARVQ